MTPFDYMKAMAELWGRGGQDFAQRNKRAINHHAVHGNERLRKHRRRQGARVGFFHHNHAAILAQLPGELTLAHVHGINPHGTPLQQTIGKPAR